MKDLLQINSEQLSKRAQYPGKEYSSDNFLNHVTIFIWRPQHLLLN